MIMDVSRDDVTSEVKGAVRISHRVHYSLGGAVPGLEGWVILIIATQEAARVLDRRPPRRPAAGTPGRGRAARRAAVLRPSGPACLGFRLRRRGTGRYRRPRRLRDPSVAALA